MLKRIVVFLLALALLSGAALAENSLSDLKNRKAQPAATEAPAAEEEQAAGLTDRSLWDKQISARFVDIPGAGFKDGDRLISMTADGRRVLIDVQNGPACLLDLETGERIALTPAAAWVEEVIRERTQQAAHEETDLTGTELLDAYFAALNQGMERWFWFLPVALPRTGGNLLYVADRTGGIWSVDGDTGSVYGPLGGPLSVQEGRGLYMRSIQETALVDLETGEEQALNLTGDASFDHALAVRAVCFGEDGSVAALVRDAKLDKEKGQACALAIVQENGAKRFYSLGSYFFGREPDSILLQGNQALVWSRQYAQATMPLVVDLDSGAVTALYSRPQGEAAGLCLLPMEETLNELDWPTMPEFGKGIIPIMALADGETFLVQQLSGGEFTLLRPQTGEAKVLTVDGVAACMPILSSFTGNGYDRFACVFMGETHILNKTNELQYLQIEVR